MWIWANQIIMNGSQHIYVENILNIYLIAHDIWFGLRSGYGIGQTLSEILSGLKDQAQPETNAQSIKPKLGPN